MSITITAYFVAIALGDVEITRFGPLTSTTGCMYMKHQIDESIQSGFQNYAVYGMTGDQWGVGGGAIYSNSDYALKCIGITVDVNTAEILYEYQF